MSKPKILFFLISTALLADCSKVDDIFPQATVNIALDSNIDLATLGVTSSMICKQEGGFMGVILYRNAAYEFYAFDRTCTYYPKDTSAVIIESAGNTYKCPKCGSEFIVSGGDAIVLQGPAKYPLRRYQTHIENLNRLYIKIKKAT
jgi:Rieske Fe-S protein